MAQYYPAQDTDDSWQDNNGINYPTTDPVSVRADATLFRIGALRAQLSSVNQGDVIYTGTLYVYLTSTLRDDVHCDVIGELVASPGTFTSDSNHISGRITANPTTATVEWQNTGTGVGWYSIDVSTILQELVNQGSWSNGGYVVLFLDPRAYTSGEFTWISSYSSANPWYLDITSGPANSSPTIALNTADASTLDTTPTVEFTGSDADSDDLRYEVQITDNPVDFTGGNVITSQLTTGSGTIIHPQPVGGTTWEGYNQVDDRVGQAFQARGGILDSVDFYFGPHETFPEDTDGYYVAHLYNMSGTPVDPVPDAWAASTAYSQNDYIRPTSTANGDIHQLYRCKTAGTSGGTEPSWPGSGVLWTTVSEGTEVNDGTAVWEVVYPAYPPSPAAPSNTPTPGWLAITDAYAYAPGTADEGWKTLDFTGANRIRLTPDAWYMIILDWRPSNTTGTNVIAISTSNFGDATAAGSLYLDSSSTNNNGPRIIGDARYRIRETFETLDKVSGTDAGFANTVTGGDTDPFNAGEKISFTVQSADELDGGITYYWRARVIDPGGVNIWSDWATARSFTTFNTFSLVAAVLAASASTAASLAVQRPLSAQSLSASASAAASLAALRTLAAVTAAASATSTPILDIAGLLQLTATILAASTDTPPSLAVQRPFVAESLSASALSTPSLALLMSMVGAALGSSATTGLSLAVLRAVAAIALSDSAASGPSLAVQRPFAVVTAGSSVTNTPILNLTVLLQLVASLLSASTSTTPSLAVQRPLSAQAAGISSSTTPSLAVLREMMAAAAGSGITTSPSLAVLRAAASAILASSSTGNSSLAILRAVMAAILADSSTSAAILNLTAALQLAASMLALSSAASPSLAVSREMSGQALGSSVMTDPSLAVLRALTAVSAVSSSTSLPDFSFAILLAAAMLAQSDASAPAVDIAAVIGLVSVLFSASTPGAAFTSSGPGVAFTSARPDITFTGRRS